MGDPYWRYGASADRVSVPRPSFPGQLSADPVTLPSHNPYDLCSNPIDYAQKDVLPVRPGPYGVINGIGAHDIASGVPPVIPDLINDRPASLPKVDGTMESNVLFVDGLPTDCLRREVGHLFRPFIGFKDIRVVHKEPRRAGNLVVNMSAKRDLQRLSSPYVLMHLKFLSSSCMLNITSNGDKAMVLCFVEFDDAKCALTAMEALEGYKFDDKKPDSPVLRIHFAHFPFTLPTASEHGEPRIRV